MRIEAGNVSKKKNKKVRGAIYNKEKILPPETIPNFVGPKDVAWWNG